MRAQGHITALIIAAVGASQSMAGGIVGSKHDLSPTNYYAGTGRDYGTQATNEVCIFCHTPHHANSDLDKDGGNDNEMPDGRARAPLWNRALDDASVYTPYTSQTMNMVCDDTPSPLSLACLSCHDSAAASGDVGAVQYFKTHNVVNGANYNNGWATPKCGGCHPGGGDYPGDWWQVGPDLSDDHPVSLSYPEASDDPDFNIPPNPSTGWSDVKLFNGRVECPSCHNPHDPTNVPFLRKPVSGSSLCLTCHAK